MRRPAERAPLVPPVTDSEADRIRQMLHELRTPVNAIQGFAEAAQQQLFGPTPHDYRALAAGIAATPREFFRLLKSLSGWPGSISGAMELDKGETDLAAVVEVTVGQLSAHTASRGSGFALKVEAETLPVALDRLGSGADRLAPARHARGNQCTRRVLKLKLRSRGGLARVDLTLPAALASKDDDALFQAAAGTVPQVISAGVFGVWFASRLARAEARAAGGLLVRKDAKLRLTLPDLTAIALAHTEGA